MSAPQVAKNNPVYKFADWFEAQYGSAPERSEHDALMRVQAAERALARERDDLCDIIEYSTRRDAALKAWCAK